MPFRKSKPAPKTPEQRKAARDEAYYGSATTIEAGSTLAPNMKDSERFALLNLQAAVVDQASFQKYLEQVLSMDHREDVFNRYAELSLQEKFIFANALSKRDILDKTKGSRFRKGNKIHVDQAGYESAIKDEAQRLSDENLLLVGDDYLQDWSQVDDTMEVDMPKPETFQRAARGLLSHQMRDDDDSGKTSKRSSLVDIKLVNRAFKFLGEVRQEAEKDSRSAATTGKDKKATMSMRYQAMNVKNMQDFHDFLKHMQEVNEEGNNEFFELDEMEQRLFVVGLCNLEAIFTENLLIRGYRDEARKKRDSLKETFAKVGEVYTANDNGEMMDSQGKAAPSLDGMQKGELRSQIEQLMLKPGDFAKAAGNLLIEKGGVLDKHKIGYNQRLIPLAVRFAQAAQLARIRELEEKHKNFQRPDANAPEAKKSALERLVPSRADDVSTSHKLTARATRLHYERAKMRLHADKVKDVASLEAFLEIAIPGTEQLSKFKALDDNQKILATIGLARRSIINRKADRSRMRPVQSIADKTKSGKEFDNMQGRQDLINLMHVQRKVKDAVLDDSIRLVVDEHTAKAAAINLLGKETQGAFSFKDNADLGLLTRALELVQEEDDMFRAEEEVARMSGGTHNSLKQKLNAIQNESGITENSHTSMDSMDQPKSLVRPEQKFKDPAHAKIAQALGDRLVTADTEGYDASRIANRQSLLNADGVSDKNSFDNFLEAILKEGGQESVYNEYATKSERDQYFIIKALANRKTIDRNWDMAGSKGHRARAWQIFSLGITRQHHKYQDRQGRDALKKMYAERDNSRSVELATEEYSLAARALLSSKTRSFEGLTTKLKMNERRSQADTALLGRAFKLVDVMRAKREEALRGALEDMTSLTYDEGEKKPELTMRANMDQLDALAGATDSDGFFEFLKSMESLEYAERYSQLTPEEKQRFIYALSHRDMIDKAHAYNRTANTKAVKDLGARGEALHNFALTGHTPEVDARDYMRAAYELASGRTRALGTHRVLAIKSGALDTGLMDRAFLFVQESNRTREKVLDVDRQKKLKAAGADIQLSEKVSSEDKEAALAVSDLDSFVAFLERATGTAQKEKYNYLFNAYDEPERKLFVLALRNAKFCDSAIAYLATGKESGALPASFVVALTKHAQLEDFELSPDDYRIAATSMLQTKLTHKRFDSEPFKKANALVQAAIKAFVKNTGRSLEEDMDEYARGTGGTGLEETEFTRRGRYEQSNAVGRNVIGYFANKKHSIKKDMTSASDWGQQQTAFEARGYMEGVGKKAKRFGLTAAGTAAGVLGGDIKTQAEKDDAKKDFQTRLESGAGGMTMDGFEVVFSDYAKKEHRVSMAIAFKKFNQWQKVLFIRALADRSLLDLSHEASQYGEGEDAVMERRYENAQGRDALLDEAVGGLLEQSQVSAADIKKASDSLFSARTVHKGKYSSAFNQEKQRSTLVDWKLVERALEMVTLANEERKYLDQLARDEASGEKDDENRERIRSTFRSTGKEEKGALSDLMRFKQENQDLIDAGSIIASAAGFGYKAVSGGFSKEEKYTATDHIKAFGKIGAELNEAFSAEGTEFISKLLSSSASIMGEMGVLGLPMVDIATDIVNVVAGSVELVGNVSNYRGNEAEMQRFLIANMPKDASGMDKDNIAVEALKNAFGVVKEQSSRSIASSVFDIVENLAAAGASAAKMAGIPKPLVKTVLAAVNLVLKIGRKIADSIITLVQGDVVDRFLNIKEIARKHNQRVKAENLFRKGSSNQKVQALSEDEVKTMVMRQMGFEHLDDCKQFACKSIASGVVYSYHSPNVPDHQRIGARSTAVRMGSVDSSGELDHRDLIRKLMGAEG